MKNVKTGLMRKLISIGGNIFGDGKVRMRRVDGQHGGGQRLWRRLRECGMGLKT